MFTAVVLVVIYVPLALVLLNSFNTDRTFGWPPPGYTTRWWELAWHSQGARDALWTSVQVAVCATVIALVLGTLAAMGLRRTRFFGRNVVSLLIILPIALPGIVTGLAFQNGFRTILGIQLSIWTIVIAHATFCIVTVFNNVQARFQRLGGNLEQASMDLGAGPFTTFRLITLPMLRSALLAGALLSFGLSFDEIVVTTFTASAQDRRCRSGSSRTCSGPTRHRSSTASPPRWWSSRRSRSTWPSGCPGNAAEAMTGAR